MSCCQIIPIFFTFNNDYVEPAAVCFYSLLKSRKINNEYRLYVLHHDISESKQQLLLDIVNKFDNANLEFINTGDFFDNFFSDKKNNFRKENNSFTSDTLVRCFGARFFPQYDRIIYSDVDIIVVDDISELHSFDVDDKYILGVKNPFTKYDPYELSHLKKEHYNLLKDKYLAGGIWLMNLKKIRDDKIEDYMIDIINDKTIIKRWNDQDVMNIACNGKVGFIPLRYISYPDMLTFLQDEKFVSEYSRDELYDSLISPKIIHFANKKPWKTNTNYSTLWWTYFLFLNLNKTHIFAENNEKSKIARLEKKCKKYKCLYKSFLMITLLLIFFVTAQYLLEWKIL